jgi:hypothetical protein
MKHQLYMLHFRETNWTNWQLETLPGEDVLLRFFANHDIDISKIAIRGNGAVTCFALTDPREVWHSFSKSDLTPTDKADQIISRLATDVPLDSAGNRAIVEALTYLLRARK